MSLENYQSAVALFKKLSRDMERGRGKVFARFPDPQSPERLAWRNARQQLQNLREDGIAAEDIVALEKTSMKIGAIILAAR